MSSSQYLQAGFLVKLIGGKDANKIVTRLGGCDVVVSDHVLGQRLGAYPGFSMHK